jgi:hypothetical protein
LYISLIAGLFGLLALKNFFWDGKYQSWKWNVVKSLIEAAVIVLMAAYAPALLVSMIVIWISGHLKLHSKYMLGVLTCAIAISLGHLANWAIELLSLMAAAVIGIVSKDVIMNYRERRRRRGY